MPPRRPADMQRLPRAMSEGMINEFCREVPEAAQWVRACILPEEVQPRHLLTPAGLWRFRQWLAAPPAPPVELLPLVLLQIVSLSYEAYLITDPAECKQLCQPVQAGEAAGPLELLTGRP